MPKPMREHLAETAHAADLLAGDVFMASSGAGQRLGRSLKDWEQSLSNITLWQTNITMENHHF